MSGAMDRFLAGQRTPQQWQHKLGSPVEARDTRTPTTWTKLIPGADDKALSEALLEVQGAGYAVTHLIAGNTNWLDGARAYVLVVAEKL